MPTNVANRMDSIMPKVQPIPANDAVAATNTYRIDMSEKSISVTERVLNRMTILAIQIMMRAALTADDDISLNVSENQKTNELKKKLFAPLGALDLSATDQSSTLRKSLTISDGGESIVDLTRVLITTVLTLFSTYVTSLLLVSWLNAMKH